MDTTSLQDLLNSTGTGATSSTTTDQIMNWLFISSIVFTVVFLIVYIAHIMHRRKVENAILEIRDILRDMRDGQLAHTATPVEAPAAAETDIKPPESSSESSTDSEDSASAH